ncbi:unnamed protein product [Clonostachys rosea]|uniref:GST C-terminal domain-containing protein n=1 Tax=Bionectria ochroleuca TaxID=29856 RepID=A0ABY6TWH0_BIOOC|nr:unnamed protein product [Clonostachys rosea]
MSSLETLTIHSNQFGCNPWKVAIVLEELGVPYKHEFISFADMKKEPFESLNPNGRAPSGAIISYIIDQYDKSEKLHYSSFPETYLTRSWEHFQSSGQGPYFGQLVWFRTYHEEKLPSAITRYTNEINRVTGVLDAHLKKHGTGYLVGDRLTYADLMFLTWTYIFEERYPGDFDFSGFEAYTRWLANMRGRSAVKKVWAEWVAAKKTASG